MTTNKEEKISSEDRKILVTLLDDYSEKLALMCNKLENLQLKIADLYKDRYFTFPLGLLVSAFLGFLVIFNQSRSASPSISISILFLTGTPITFMVLFTMFYYERVINPLSKVKREFKLLVRDVDILAIKLEKVVRTASQTEEHFLVNPFHRLELDLRLADAEAALRRYEVIVKGNKLA